MIVLVRELHEATAQKYPRTVAILSVHSGKTSSRVKTMTTEFVMQILFERLRPNNEHEQQQPLTHFQAEISRSDY